MIEICHCKINYLFAKFKTIIFLFKAMFLYMRTYMYVIVESVMFLNFFILFICITDVKKLKKLNTFYHNIYKFRCIQI